MNPTVAKIILVLSRHLAPEGVLGSLREFHTLSRETSDPIEAELLDALSRGLQDLVTATQEP